ncbi:MAG: acyl-CoA thioesterase [Chloroflexota bacterium]
MPAFISHHQIEWGETDAASIVYYPNYYRWFDNATHELLRAAGHPVEHLLSTGCATPLIESHARFRGPLFYGDTIEVRSVVAEVRTRGYRIEHIIIRDGTLVGDGHEVRVWVHLGGHGASLRAEPLPQSFRECLRQFEA